jgi:hypothetical protein
MAPFFSAAFSLFFVPNCTHAQKSFCQGRCTLPDLFTQAFKDEHRAIQDTLLSLIRAFQARDRACIEALLQQAIVSMGPHFRYEEEALYPAVVEIFGQRCMEHLLEDHRRAVRIVKTLTKVARKNTITEKDIVEAARLIQNILLHIKDCEWLSPVVEQLPAEKLQVILDARVYSLSVGLDLLQWANRIEVASPDGQRMK